MEIFGERVGKERYRKMEKAIPLSRHFSTICKKKCYNKYISVMAENVNDAP